VIELGVPFSDPLADGPVIQRASERALKHGTSLQNVLTLAAEIREHSQSVGLVIFSYLNPILRMGLAKFCQVARLAGIDGVLITDLPSKKPPNICAKPARTTSQPFSWLRPPAPTSALSKSPRFRPALSTPSRAQESPARAANDGDAQSLVKRVRRFTKLPIAVGFGISTPEQFQAIGKFAEAAVVGSAIVHAIEQNPGREAATVAEFVRQLLASSF